MLIMLVCTDYYNLIGTFMLCHTLVVKCKGNNGYTYLYLLYITYYQCLMFNLVSFASVLTMKFAAVACFVLCVII